MTIYQPYPPIVRGNDYEVCITDGKPIIPMGIDCDSEHSAKRWARECAHYWNKSNEEHVSMQALVDEALAKHSPERYGNGHTTRKPLGEAYPTTPRKRHRRMVV
ncbi:MAG: hypothetical protein E6R03_01010 [Hyphomicrobiaceae bacterium]|nr:MAG: hypothetical protein E6R03_01010 [Hyphomicrobiaceae bacterium]